MALSYLKYYFYIFKNNSWYFFYPIIFCIKNCCKPIKYKVVTINNDWFWKLPKYSRDEFIRLGLLDKRNWVDSTISYADKFKEQLEHMEQTHKNGLQTEYDIDITVANELAEFREPTQPKKDPLFTTEVCKELQEHWKRQETVGTMEYENIQYLKKNHGYGYSVVQKGDNLL